MHTDDRTDGHGTEKKKLNKERSTSSRVRRWRDCDNGSEKSWNTICFPGVLLNYIADHLVRWHGMRAGHFVSDVNAKDKEGDRSKSSRTGHFIMIPMAQEAVPKQFPFDLRVKSDNQSSVAVTSKLSKEKASDVFNANQPTKPTNQPRRWGPIDQKVLGLDIIMIPMFQKTVQKHFSSDLWDKSDNLPSVAVRSKMCRYHYQWHHWQRRWGEPIKKF